MLSRSKRPRWDETANEFDGFAVDHALDLAREFYAMYQAKDSTDLTVQVGKRRFQLHQAVVRVGSGYFRVLLSTDIGTFAGHTELADVTPEAFEAIAESLYTGRIKEITEETVFNLLDASRRLEALRVETQCIQWLQEHMSEANVLAIEEAAGLLGIPDLRLKAVRMAASRWDTVSGSDGFLALEADKLAELVSNDALAVNEREVYEAVMRWVEHDAASRRGDLSRVLGAVRLGLLPEEYLANGVAQNPLVQQCADAQAMLLSAFLSKYDQTKALAMRRREHKGLRTLYVFGGIHGRQCRHTAVRFDVSSGQWRAQALPDMIVARWHCAAAAIEGTLYVVGGADGGNRGRTLKSAQRIDPLVGSWEALPDMCDSRQGCSAAAIEGKLYVVGGANTEVLLKSAECYIPEVGLWQRLPDMSIARCSCGMASIDGKLYVVGGHVGYVDRTKKSTNTMECFDPSLGRWQTLPSMSDHRNGWGVASIDGKLYVVGGVNTEGLLNSAECFDPLLGEWQKLPPMSVKRCGCAAASIEGKLYVVGGQLSPAQALRSVECFDPSLGKWMTVSDMLLERAWCAAASV